MSLETCGYSCKVQGRISKRTDSTQSRLTSLFGEVDKLANTQAPSLGLFNIPVVSLKSFNVLTATFASLEALSRVYSNEKI